MVRFPFVALLFIATVAHGADHAATPIHELMERAHHAPPRATRVDAPPQVRVDAARTFAITAHQFSYDVTPAPFAVEVGDTVTLNITASDDGIGAGHGFFLEQYAEDLNTVRAGATRTIQFVATLPGTFTYFCTEVCGDGHPTMAGVFTVRESSAPAPTVISFTPTRGPAAGGTAVAINGTNFQPGAQVVIGDVNATSVSVVSAQRINAVTPPQDGGDVEITVINPDLKSGAGQQLFTYESVTVPVNVTSISPTTGTTAGGTELTVIGSGFVNGATVSIGGVPAVNPVVLNATTILATTPVGPSNIDSPTPRDVVVTNPNGTFGRLSVGFSWILQPLELTSIFPDHGPAAGGTHVTINGAGITTEMLFTVLFGGVPAKNVEVFDAVTLTAVAPAGNGQVDVVVRRGNESATLAKAFQFESTGTPKRRAVKK